MTRRGIIISLSKVCLLALLTLAVVLPVIAHTGLDQTRTPYRDVIVDTDMGLDDVRAIFALLADSTLDIRGIVTVGGSASAGKGTDNLIGLLEAAGPGSIEVLVGSDSPELQLPPWRQTANALGGEAFPPPRVITPKTAIPAGLSELLEANRGIEYLALGPLGNLHELEQESPGSLLLIDTIWLPARVRDNRITDWNVLHDSQASQAVFDRAGRVIIIDISGCQGVDAVSYLSSLDGNSSSVRWITRLLSHMGSHRGHVLLYDELATAGFSREDLLIFTDETYSVRMAEEQTFELVPNRHGNVRVAKLVDCDGALANLKSLWEHGPLERRSARSEDAVPAEILLRSFHGHLGPYVVIGYRMGRLALDELHSEGHFGISAEVHSPLEPPRSCLIDGVQIGSGCTLGKRNIQVHAWDEPAWVVFESDRGEQVTIRLRPEIPALVQELVDLRGVEAAGHAFFEMHLDSLFARDRGTR